MTPRSSADVAREVLDKNPVSLKQSNTTKPACVHGPQNVAVEVRPCHHRSLNWHFLEACARSNRSNRSLAAQTSLSARRNDSCEWQNWSVTAHRVPKNTIRFRTRIFALSTPNGLLPALATEDAKRGTCLFTPCSCAQTSLLQKRHVKRPVRHTENEFGPQRSPGASLLSYVGRARRQPRRKRPIGPQKSTSAASQGARAAQEATDAAPGTLTRRRQPALARDCSSPRGGASSTPRRPERDRGRASPGHPSAAPHRLRAPGDDSHLGGADRRQIASTARAGGRPPARGTGTRA